MRTTLSMLITACSMSGAAFADQLPFVGAWNCQVGIFTFTDTTYQPGEGAELLPIQRVQLLDPTSYALTFPDDYVIALSNVTPTEMGWFSEASGDGFDCQRVK